MAEPFHAFQSCEQKHLFMERKSRLQGTALRGPEVTLIGERDGNQTSNEINTRDVPHFLLSPLVQAWIRLNEICQNFEDHIQDS